MAAPSWLTERPIAHRGLHDGGPARPENSLAAIDAAVAAGFAVEIDLRLSRDGEAVVFHDETLERLAGRPERVDALTWPELSDLPLLGGEERIPVLADVLVRVAGRTPLFLELKVEAEEAGPRLVAAVASSLAPYRGKVALMSFDPKVLRLCRRFIKGAPIGFLWASPRRESGGSEPRRSPRLMRTTLRLRPDFIGCEAAALGRPGPRLVRGTLGRKVLAWTVTSPAGRLAAERRADQIIFEGFDPRAAAAARDLPSEARP